VHVGPDRIMSEIPEDAAEGIENGKGKIVG